MKDLEEQITEQHKYAEELKAENTKLRKKLKGLKIRGVKPEFFYEKRGITLFTKEGLEEGPGEQYVSLSVEEFNDRIDALLEE